MSEPDPPPPFDTSTLVVTVRAEIYDGADVLVRYYAGPIETLDANVPGGGRYVLLDAGDTRQWPPMPAAFEHLPPEPEPPP